MNTSAKCPRCEDGRVPCQYADSPGCYGGLPENCYPDESEVEEIGACDECGASDWTDAEIEQMAFEASKNWEPPEPCMGDV